MSLPTIHAGITPVHGPLRAAAAARGAALRAHRRTPALLAAGALHALLLLLLWQLDALPWQADEAAPALQAVPVVLQDRVQQRSLTPPPPDVPSVQPMAVVMLDLPVVKGPSPILQVAPVAAAPPARSEAPAGPILLGSELAVSCPVREPPRYPAEARRRREQGTVILRVGLDEAGRVDQVAVAESSGSRALDAAGVTAVKAWRCSPAEREGRPVRAVATQALEFVLERR